MDTGFITSQPLFAARNKLFGFGFLPDGSGCGWGVAAAGSVSNSATVTSRTLAKLSSLVIVTFSVPRSTRPTYERSISASRARRSCESPFATRRRRKFQPRILRAFMTSVRTMNGLTIDGLLVPYLLAAGLRR